MSLSLLACGTVAISLLVAVVAVCWWPLQTVWTRTGTVDRMSDLIWFQAVWHSDRVPVRIFWKG